MATARLRKAFRYPSESDSDDPAEGIDEEEQEKLINKLRSEDASRSDFYIRAFLALPVLAVLYFLPPLIRPESSGALLNVILSISSLICTALILLFVPVGLSFNPSNLYGLFRSKSLSETVRPLEYMAPLNAILCALLAVAAWRASRRNVAHEQNEEDPWRYLIPLVVFITVMIARTQLRPVDIEGLNRLKYRYKGA